MQTNEHAAETAALLAVPLSKMQQKLLYSKREAAALLSISLRTLENLIANRELSVRRVGKRVLLTHQTLTNFIRHDHQTEMAQ